MTYTYRLRFGYTKECWDAILAGAIVSTVDSVGPAEVMIRNLINALELGGNTETVFASTEMCVDGLFDGFVDITVPEPTVPAGSPAGTTPSVAGFNGENLTSLKDDYRPELVGIAARVAETGAGLLIFRSCQHDRVTPNAKLADPTKYGDARADIPVGDRLPMSVTAGMTKNAVAFFAKNSHSGKTYLNAIRSLPTRS